MKIHFRDGNMARKTEKVENLEMSTVGTWNISKTENHGK